MRKKLLAALFAGSAMLLTSAAAQAAYTITLGGNPIVFDSIDWSSGGTAWSPNYDPNGAPMTPAGTFDLYVMAKAVSLNLGPSQVYSFGGAEELTIFTHLNETIAGNHPGIPAGNTQDFIINSGSWSIFRDAANNADPSTGVGFADGTKILGGLFDPGTSGGSFTATSAVDGAGSQILLGFVDLLPSGAIVPQPDKMVAVTTVQVGNRATGWVPPSGFSNGIDGGTDPLYDPTTQLVLQADANQAFSSIPEPSSMALLGLGLGLTALRRRKLVLPPGGGES